MGRRGGGRNLRLAQTLDYGFYGQQDLGEIRAPQNAMVSWKPLAASKAANAQDKNLSPAPFSLYFAVI